MAGGLILGFAEAYTAGYWPGQAGTRWTNLVIFSILIVFMVFRPQGLFGRADIKKV
jgi:branched-chain amino acid transport system permease protein